MTADLLECMVSDIRRGHRSEFSRQTVLKRFGMRRIKARWFARNPETLPTGVANGNARLDDTKIRAIRTAIAADESRTSVAGRFGISPKYVRQIVNRERWKHVA